MMAIEKAAKRGADGMINSVETKKRRVEFADEVMVHDEDGEKHSNQDFSAKLYRNFVLSAIEDVERNDASQINTLASQLSLPSSSPDRISPGNLSILLQTLSYNISKLDTPLCTSLIQSVINFEKWWELPTATLGTYIFFIKILCSSLPKWWQDVSLPLISEFTLPVDQTVQHHEMLKYFLRTIPTCTGFIDSYIAKFFPNKNDSKRNLVNYIANVLLLTDYCNELRFQSWSLVIEKVISIDVELQNELDELDDDLENNIDDELDDGEVESDEDDQNLDNDSDDDSANDLDDDDLMDGQEEYNVDVTQNIKQLSSKLDAILSLITKRLSQSLTAQSIENGDGVSIFNTLISLFKSHILPTYYTRSIQYILFHVSQQQLELMDAFLVTLIDIAFSPNETIEKRIKSLQYIGSFIARAKKLTNTQIIFVSSYLTSWLNRYVLEREEEVNQPGGVERFKHFYAAFQALCYVFCFRHAIFRDGDTWECEIDKFFQRMVLSKFNPLKYCNENVMMMFARIAQHEGVAYCFSIIENNNNERMKGIMGKSDSQGYNGVVSNWSLATRQQFIDLQSYFPYDPLFLKTYKRMMRDYYIEWSDVSREYESDESDELDELNRDL
ncbi:RNA polymerase I-specific transcription initiation factor RRN3 [Lachancea thermotolerans]|uniref:KLTH0D04840p n=1 Tax=Lachancea thermotolerans (strain ATCC 56472 / CBS 6340 / NRRL Y-8284) TaxID=559295 RepID=C5DGF2_LACTC|nr:KLTH0D04840p [Lachancea thermotolerans CBS 6340]CAR22494.1 KLTH0D04840p [Lachancea thermotolerans CBS 6340]